MSRGNVDGGTRRTFLAPAFLITLTSLWMCSIECYPRQVLELSFQFLMRTFSKGVESHSPLLRPKINVEEGGS